MPKHFERIVAVAKNFATHSFSLPTSVCARFGKWGGPGIALSSSSERLARIIIFVFASENTGARPFRDRLT